MIMMMTTTTTTMMMMMMMMMMMAIRSNVQQLEAIAFVRNLRTRFGTVASATNSL